jgi:hypothetical protein
MNPFLLPPEERLRNWRDLRKSLTNDLTEKEHLEKISEYWSQCPLQNMIIDPYNPKTWMTPWELINYGQFCKHTVGYLIEQTLLFTESDYWNDQRVQLVLIKDVAISDIALVVVIDNEFVLNYNYRSIINYKSIENQITILGKYKYDPDSKLHIEY